MRATLRLTLLAPVIALGCTNIHSFTPASSARFEPTTAEITVLDSEPPQEFEVIGYAEARGGSLKEALPLLKKLAQDNGGNALLKIESTGIGYGVSNYRAKVIRYTP